MQYLIYGLKTIGFSQLEFAETGDYEYLKDSKSHRGMKAVDMQGEDVGSDVYRAPCNLKVLGFGTTHTVYFGSCDENGNQAKVRCADGMDRVLTIALTHMDDLSKDTYVGTITKGKIYKSGEICYREGSYGLSKTANHVHIEVADGWTTTKIKNIYGYYQFPNTVALEPRKVFFGLRGYNVIRDDRIFGTEVKWVYSREVIELPTKKTISYNGLTVSIIRSKGIASVCSMGEFKKQLPGKFTDAYLDKDHTQTAMINGSLFFTEGGYTYANGIEVVGGKVLENDDSAYDDVMAFGITWDGYPVFATQKEIKDSISNYRSALTAAFGLYKDGKRCIGNATRMGSYSSKSGRSIFAYNRDNNEYILIGFQGTTGKTGLTGPQCVSLVEYLNENICKITDAVCMDGGGSVYQEYQDTVVFNTSRQVKNTIALYDEKGAIEDMKLKIVPKKEVLYLRKSYSFSSTKKTIYDIDYMTGKKVAHSRYYATGEIAHTVKIGESVEVVEPMPEIGKDGWQWFKVLYDGQELYAQYDSMVYVLEKY